MFSWMKKNDSQRNQVFNSVVDGLRKLYFKTLKPLEEAYLFNDFHSPAMSDPDFVAKPMVLLVGQYSTGKTTFIRYLLEREFPGIRIGPEPTTDSFIAVMHGDNEQVIPGNALIVDPSKPFRTLSSFGNAFLNRFCCSELPSPVLESITIVDTPGILSGEKQSVSRGYDFTGILKWFAERCDRIILLFDAHKLDISDEFQRGIEVLRDYDDKIRIVLNKADMVTTQQLMRVYGALMWSLGKVINTPEVARVFIGSFWNQPLQIDENRKLFEYEANDLFNDIQTLPRNAALRKLNDFIKRARLAKVSVFLNGNRSIRPRVDPPRITRDDPPRIIQSRSNLPCKQLDIICLPSFSNPNPNSVLWLCMDIVLWLWSCRKTFRYHLLRSTVIQQQISNIICFLIGSTRYFDPPLSIKAIPTHAPLIHRKRDFDNRSKSKTENFEKLSWITASSALLHSSVRSCPYGADRQFGRQFHSPNQAIDRYFHSHVSYLIIQK